MADVSAVCCVVELEAAGRHELLPGSIVKVFEMREPSPTATSESEMSNIISVPAGMDATQ